MKKLFGLVAVVALALQVNAATEIGTVDDFINNVVADPSGDYILTADLTFDKLAAIPEFSGTLDGDGHKITGTISNFMGKVTGTIKNLTIYGLNFEHQRIKSNVVAPMGGFALLLQGGTISNCTLLDSSLTMPNGYSANVTDVGFGGIVAHVAGGSVSDCKIIGCTIGGRTSSTSQLQPFGGIVGRVMTEDPVTIARCQILNGETRDTTIAGCRVGGILGSATSLANLRIEGCYNEGVISNAILEVGGIMGNCADSNSSKANIEICGCTNVANITVACGGAGGIFGYTYKGGRITIIDCVNRGNISSRGNSGHGSGEGTGVGGIVGGYYSYNETGGIRINRCANYGAIFAATNSAGGIVGEYKNGNAATQCIISNSVNHASVTSSAYAGGMIGAVGHYESGSQISGDILVNCCQTGDVVADGELAAGGLIGYLFGNNKVTDNLHGVCQLGTVTAANGSASPVIGSTGHGTKAFTLDVAAVQIGGSATCANGTVGIITGGAGTTSTGAFKVNVDDASFFANNTGTAYYDQTGAAQELALGKLADGAMTDGTAVKTLNTYASANGLMSWVQTENYPELSMFAQGEIPEPAMSGLLILFR